MVCCGRERECVGRSKVRGGRGIEVVGWVLLVMALIAGVDAVVGSVGDLD
jgi:hypothetical protein